METAVGAAYDRATLFGGQPRYAAQSPWGPFAAAAATVVVFLGQLAGVLVALLFVYATSPDGFGMGSYHAQKLLSLDNPIGVSIVVGSQLASIGLVWLFASRGGMRAQVLQMSRVKPSWGTCLAGGLIVIAVTAVVELILYVGIGFDFRADAKWLADGLRSVWWPVVVFMAVVLAPLWEELTFRGFLLSALAQTRLGFWGAALISNTAWAALHGNYSVAGMISVFTAGLVLSWLLWRTGSIRAPIVGHAVANLAATGFAMWVMVD